MRPCAASTSRIRNPLCDDRCRDAGCQLFHDYCLLDKLEGNKLTCDRLCRQPRRSDAKRPSERTLVAWRAFRKCAPRIMTVCCSFVDLCGTLNGLSSSTEPVRRLSVGPGVVRCL